MFREAIKKEIQSIVGDSANFSVEVPENPEHGDYASNAALILAKKEGKNPREVAEDLKAKLLSLPGAKWERIEIAGPGFLNFWIKNEELAKQLGTVLDNPEKWGSADVGKNKKVI